MASLQASGPDISSAVLRLLRSGAATALPAPLVALHKTGHRSVIVVRPVAALRRLDGLDLISLGDPQRALIAFSDAMAPAQFELRLQDLLDDPDLPRVDREVIEQLSRVLRDARRSARCRVSGARIIVLDEGDGPSRRA